MSANTILDVLFQGPIVYPTFSQTLDSFTQDQQQLGDAIVTISGSYFHLWRYSGEELGWEGVECRYTGEDITKWTIDRAISEARRFYYDILDPDEDD